MNKYLQNIIREELLNALKEEEIPTSPFTDAEEKFLAKFVELGTQSLGILYTKNEVGIREFLMRSGKDYNLTPDVLSKLMKDGIISIVPYGGYARNEDYTIKCNLPLDELEGLSSGDSKEGDDTGTPPADDAGDTPEPDTAPLDDTGEPQESASSSLDLSKLLVSEQKRHTSTRVYTNKSRALRRLPKGYVVYLEKIIKILGQKLHTDLEKQHLVADILDNLAHNFGLTPKQVYKSFIFYNSQNRLKNVVRESVVLNEQGGPNALEIPLGANFDSGKYKQLTNNFKQELNIALQGKITKFLETHKDNEINVTIEAGESQVTNFDNEVSPAKEVKPGYLSQKRGESLKAFLNAAFLGLVKEKLLSKVPTIDIKTIVGKTKYTKGVSDPKDPAYKKEQFVKLIISVSGKKHQCLINLKIQIAYDPKRKAGHTCDQAIFEIKANGINLGIANLNNSSKDLYEKGKISGYGEWEGKTKYSSEQRRNIAFKQIMPKVQKYALDNFNNSRINKSPAGYYEYASAEERKILLNLFTKYAQEIDTKLTVVTRSTKSGQQFLAIPKPKSIDPEVSFAVSQNAVGGQARFTDGAKGGARSQTFILSDSVAKQVQGDNDQIELTIKPLVEASGKYYMFYNYAYAISTNPKQRAAAGSHSDTPYVTITNAKDDQLYQGFPDAGLSRGSTEEVVLIRLDKCGNPLKST